VINQTTGAYYVWVTPDGTVEVPAPPAFAQFIACTPTIITLAVYTLGMEKTPTHLDAGVSKSAPPAKRLAKE
jgi:hypothetical protein